MQGTKNACGEGGCGACAVQVHEIDNKSGGFAAKHCKGAKVFSLAAACQLFCSFRATQNQVHQCLFVPCGQSGWLLSGDCGGAWQCSNWLQCCARQACLLHFQCVLCCLRLGLESLLNIAFCARNINQQCLHRANTLRFRLLASQLHIDCTACTRIFQYSYSF